MAKPISIPRWSSAAPGTSTVEPVSGKKDAGWVTDERPAAKYLNWLLYWIYNWITWVDDTIANDAVGFTGTQVLMLSPFNAARTANFSVLSSSGGYIGTAGGSGIAYLDIPLKVGDRITSVTFDCAGDGSADCTATVFKGVATGGSAVSLGAGTATNPGAGGVATVINVTDTTLAAGEAFFIEFDANAANIHISNTRVTFHHPD